jgi:aspartate/methionine/tyrosine aminotransferase
VSQRFSARTGWDIGENQFAAAIRKARESGRPMIDLTISNPTVCGFRYDEQAILSPLRNTRSLIYDPDPKGIRSAREAVADYYAGHGASVHPDTIVLTTSTSEGYGYLFRLLCDAGDEVLVAQPSYPLFDFLADLEDVKLRPYPLFYDFGWWIDFAELERRIGPRTRAIVVVHPNNPTGHGTKRAERERLEEICLRHGLALIVDEVFLDYSLHRPDVEDLVSFATEPHPVLTFCLSGLSKIAGLPQMKVGWISCFGPESERATAVARLEVIADTFLSMNAPSQLALPTWLANRTEIQKQILQRIMLNITLVDSSGLELLLLEGGWTGVIKLPRVGLEAESLLDSADVITHPGSFYGMSESGRIVVSLIGPTGDFSMGIKGILEASS